MRKRKTASPPSNVSQLLLNFDEQPNSSSRETLKVSVPIETTFDVSQGLREVKTFWHKHGSPMDIFFDCRHLELAEAYVSGSSEVFELEEVYLVGRGGLINTSVFINLLRCYQSLDTWSKSIEQNTGSRPIQRIDFVPPRSSTKVGKLWKTLGMGSQYDATNTPKVYEFQSRYITPILWVDKTNEAEVLRKFTEWIIHISNRLGKSLKTDLIMTADEVITNLVKHGFSHGFYGVSIWPSGQVEIVWSNSIEHLKDWPPDDTAGGLINGLKSGRGGAGMAYIYNELLPKYNGILAVNCKGSDLIFHASGRYSLFSQSSPERNAFLPTSILFTLHLFCSETRQRSEEHKNAD